MINRLSTHNPSRLKYGHFLDYRYAALLEYGGIYLDIDVECVQPFDGVRHHTLVIAQETAGKQVWPMMFSNHFLAAAPNQSFVSHIVKALPAWNQNLYFKYPTVFASTGPWFLTAQVCPDITG